MKLEECGNGERNEKAEARSLESSALVSITHSLTIGLLTDFYYCFAPAALLLAASGFGAL